jgi:microcystin-dependent protein
MATNIFNYDGTLLTTVQDGTIDTNHASIKFPGRGYLNYGEAVNGNMLWIMQNFAAPSAPANPVTGQTWYDTNNQLMKFYNGSSWITIGGVIANATQPGSGSNIGSFWYDTTNNQLYVWSGTQWLLVGPLGSSNNTDPINPTISSYSKIQAARIQDNATTPVNHQVWLLIVGGTLLGILSKDQKFTPGVAIPGFSDIKPGLNLNSSISGIGVAGDSTIFKANQTNLPDQDNHWDLGSSGFKLANVYATNFIGKAFKATNIAGGAVGSLPYQSGADVTSFLPVGAPGTILTSDGATVSWLPGQATTSISVANSHGSAGPFYPTFVSAAGSSEQIRCDISSLSYNPATNTLSVDYLTGTASKATNIVGGAAGSLLYQNATDVTTTLTIGASGYVLTSDGSTISWQPVPTPGKANNLTGGTTGSVPYQSSADTTAFLPIGTNGTVLQSTGTGIQWAQVGMPPGSLVPYAGSTAPTGWLLCYGQAISRTTYAALFAVIGTTWGIGDNSTTFNLPDFRGRVLAGADDMGGTDAHILGNGANGGFSGSATLGTVGGEKNHQLTTAELANHTHGNVGYGSQGVAGSVYDTMMAPYTSTVGSTGGDQAHNNVQPTAVVNYIIKI